jgi:hypothetical protein
MRRCWNVDVQRCEDGVIAALVSCRANNNVQGNDVSMNPDHRFIYCRYDGASWSYTYLGKAGGKMYISEADYTGLGALCPDDPNTIYISTSFDPRDNSDLVIREIFKGVTLDNGKSWSWIPITQKSVRDNFRPIVPAWNNSNIALLWWRGTYTSAQNFDAAIVGVIERKSVAPGQMTYVDASTLNTSFVDGSPIVTTGPDSSAGAADGKWHLRLGVGNNGSVLTSGETGGENAPAIKTHIAVSDTGTFDVWVNFWGKPGADWRIKAGLSPNTMQLFRQMASKEVELDEQSKALVLSASDNIFLYQAYLGRIQVSANKVFDVFVDDSTYRVGTQSTLAGDVDRTWYDGVSYVNLSSPTHVPVLALSKNVMNFGVVQPALNKKDSILISNPGMDTLRITAMSSTNQRFAFAPITMTLAPSASSYLFTTFSPQDTSVQSGTIQLMHNGLSSPDSIIVIGKGGSVLAIEDGKNRIPLEYDLRQNFPNPFNPSTTITYSLPKAGFVILSVYDLLGREVALLVRKDVSAGVHTVLWNAQNAPSGVYFYRIAAGSFLRIYKMMLLK